MPHKALGAICWRAKCTMVRKQKLVPCRRGPDRLYGQEFSLRPDRVLAPIKECDLPMADGDVPQEYYGWWRIVETSQWVDDHIDMIGTALISLTGEDDRLRMFVLLAHVDCKAAETGVSFTWQGAWEYDPVSGTGSVRLREDGRLAGSISIEDGDESTFIAERTEEPDEPIPDPPSYRDKWRRRW